MKKLYTATITIDMHVLAEEIQEACYIAYRHLHEDIRDYSAFDFDAVLSTELLPGYVPLSLPYGLELKPGEEPDSLMELIKANQVFLAGEEGPTEGDDDYDPKEY